MYTFDRLDLRYDDTGTSTYKVFGGPLKALKMISIDDTPYTFVKVYFDTGGRISRGSFSKPTSVSNRHVERMLLIIWTFVMMMTTDASVPAPVYTIIGGTFKHAYAYSCWQ